MNNPTKENLRVICAWCGRHLGGPLDPSSVTSHGICLDCSLKLMDEAREAANRPLRVGGLPVLGPLRK